MVRGDVRSIALPQWRGDAQQGRRYAVIVQADDLLALSTVVVCRSERGQDGSAVAPRYWCAYAYGDAAHLYPDLSQLSDRLRRACLGGAEKPGAVEPAARRRGRAASAAAPARAVVHSSSRKRSHARRHVSWYRTDVGSVRRTDGAHPPTIDTPPNPDSDAFSAAFVSARPSATSPIPAAR